MKLYELVKLLLDDFVRQRWGDLVALFLIMLGVWLVMHGMDEVVKDVGKGLVASGLVTLKLRTMPSPNGNGAIPLPETSLDSPIK